MDHQALTLNAAEFILIALRFVLFEIPIQYSVVLLKTNKTKTSDIMFCGIMLYMNISDYFNVHSEEEYKRA